MKANYKYICGVIFAVILACTIIAPSLTNLKREYDDDHTQEYRDLLFKEQQLVEMWRQKALEKESHAHLQSKPGVK